MCVCVLNLSCKRTCNISNPKLLACFTFSRDGSMVEVDRVRGETENAAEERVCEMSWIFLAVVKPLHLLFLSLSPEHITSWMISE
jgi:hypothetical protein